MPVCKLFEIEIFQVKGSYAGHETPDDDNCLKTHIGFKTINKTTIFCSWKVLPRNLKMDENIITKI